MKTFKFIISAAAALFILSSCNKGSGGDNSQQTMPINNVCVTNPSACQSQIYQQGQGFSPYSYQGYGQGYYNNGYPNYYYNGSYQVNNSSYLCNCPSGSVPTYNNYGGLGCVQSNYVYGSGYIYAYFGFGAGANNSQWVNLPQISNFKGYNQTNCYNGVVQSCLVDQPSTCSQGYTCKATAAQSRLGLCVSNTTNQGSTGQNYNGAYR